MEKLVISNEQEEALEKMKEESSFPNYSYTNPLAKFIDRKSAPFRHEFKSLNDFTPEQFALLLCGWYEVEESFQVGEWSVLEGHGMDGNIIGKVERVRGDYRELDDEGSHPFPANLLRKATAEEIAQEKKRRFWADLGREVDEYKKGDLIYSKSEQTIRECLENVPVRDDSFVMVCPVEKRFDL